MRSIVFCDDHGLRTLSLCDGVHDVEEYLL